MKVIERQHDAGNAFDRRQFIQHLRHGGVGPDHSAHVEVHRRDRVADARGRAAKVGLVVGHRLRAHPAQRVKVLAGFVSFPFRLRRGIGFVRDHHEQGVSADVPAGLRDGLQQAPDRMRRISSAC